MERQDIIDRVRTVVMRELDVEEGAVTLEASFVHDLWADSLDLVELVMALEEEFGIEIRDEDGEEIEIVNDLIRYIEQQTIENFSA